MSQESLQQRISKSVLPSWIQQPRKCPCVCDLKTANPHDTEQADGADHGVVRRQLRKLVAQDSARSTCEISAAFSKVFKLPNWNIIRGIGRIDGFEVSKKCLWRRSS